MCGGCRIALLTVSRTFSHFKPFPAQSAVFRIFSHNLELPALTGVSLDIGSSLDKNLGEFRQITGVSLDKNWGEFRQKLG